jgi:hypothetical protein
MIYFISSFDNSKILTFSKSTVNRPTIDLEGSSFFLNGPVFLDGFNGATQEAIGPLSLREKFFLAACRTGGGVACRTVAHCTILNRIGMFRNVQGDLAETSGKCSLWG